MYGGEDANSVLLQDFFFYDSQSNNWSRVSVSLQGRKGACMVCDFPTFYIIGGITTNGYQAEIWVIDLEANIASLIEITGQELPALTYAYCKLEDVDGRSKILIANAEHYNEVSSNSIFLLDVEKNGMERVSKQNSVSRSADAKVGDRLITIGGEFYGRYSRQTVFEYNFGTNIESPLANAPENISRAAYCYFKSSIYVHGGTSTSGNKHRKNIATTTMLRFELNENCQDCNYPCSPGTYMEDNVCETCLAGTYQPNYGASSCLECPEGTASDQIGVDSLLQCLPCSEGFYASMSGSTNCTPCPDDKFCHVGSSAPSDEFKEKKALSSVQPKLYSSEAGMVAFATFSIAVVFSLFGLIMILLYKSKEHNIISMLNTVDLFNDKHNHFTDEIMHLRKTPIGGLFTALFFIAALAFVIISIFIFHLDNIVEQKGLVPLVSLEEDYSSIKGNFNITAEFGSYGGNCTSEGNTCHIEIVRSIAGLQSSDPELVCYKDSSSCHVTLICKECEIGPEVKFMYQLLEDRSYAEYIKVNVTSSSSIPDETSSIEQTIFVSDGTVFRGPVASQLDFEMTSSVRPSQIFESDTPKWTSKETGFHIAATKSPVAGSESYISE
jgi:hypothetical protein